MASCTLVLGVPRSGTSCVAGILHHLGVWMGDKFFDVNDWNERGFYADEKLNELHWRIIRAHDDNASHIHPVPAITHEYAEEIQYRRNRGIPWGFKLTETPAFLHHLQAMVPELKVIRTSRRFSSSVRSWEARNHGPLDTIHDAILRMGEYVFAIDEALARCKIDPLMVSYERLIADPSPEISRIAEFVGLPVTDAALRSVDAGLSRFCK